MIPDRDCRRVQLHHVEAALASLDLAEHFAPDPLVHAAMVQLRTVLAFHGRMSLSGISEGARIADYAAALLREEAERQNS
jgi:hypothetical protein